MRSFLLIITFSIFFTTVLCIKCYDCDSLRDPRCNEYFSAEGVKETDCDEAEMPEYLEKYGRRIPATGCLTKFHEGVDGFRYFIRRACYFGDLENTEEACNADDPYLPYANILACHVCDDDLCNTNSSTVENPSFILLLSISLITILYKMFDLK